MSKNLKKITILYMLFLWVFILNAQESSAIKECFPNCNIGFEELKQMRIPSVDDIASKVMGFNQMLYFRKGKMPESEYFEGNYCSKKVIDKIAEFTEQDKQNWTHIRNEYCSHKAGWIEKNIGECQAGGPPPCCPVEHWIRSDNSMQVFYKICNEIYDARYKTLMDLANECMDDKADILLDEAEKCSRNGKFEEAEEYRNLAKQVASSPSTVRKIESTTQKIEEEKDKRKEAIRQKEEEEKKDLAEKKAKEEQAKKEKEEALQKEEKAKQAEAKRKSQPAQADNQTATNNKQSSSEADQNTASRKAMDDRQAYERDLINQGKIDNEDERNEEKRAINSKLQNAIRKIEDSDMDPTKKFIKINRLNIEAERRIVEIDNKHDKRKISLNSQERRQNDRHFEEGQRQYEKENKVTYSADYYKDKHVMDKHRDFKNSVEDKKESYAREENYTKKQMDLATNDMTQHIIENMYSDNPWNSYRGPGFHIGIDVSQYIQSITLVADSVNIVSGGLYNNSYSKGKTIRNYTVWGQGNVKISVSPFFSDFISPVGYFGVNYGFNPLSGHTGDLDNGGVYYSKEDGFVFDLFYGARLYAGYKAVKLVLDYGFYRKQLSYHQKYESDATGTTYRWVYDPWGNPYQQYYTTSGHELSEAKADYFVNENRFGVGLSFVPFAKRYTFQLLYNFTKLSYEKNPILSGSRFQPFDNYSHMVTLNFWAQGYFKLDFDCSWTYPVIGETNDLVPGTPKIPMIKLNFGYCLDFFTKSYFKNKKIQNY